MASLRPRYLLLVPPLLVYALRIRALFGSAARELKRFDGVARAPVAAERSALGAVSLKQGLGLCGEILARRVRLDAASCHCVLFFRMCADLNPCAGFALSRC